MTFMNIQGIHNQNLGTYAFMGMMLLNQTQQLQRIASEQRFQNSLLQLQLEEQSRMTRAVAWQRDWERNEESRLKLERERERTDHIEQLLSELKSLEKERLRLEKERLQEQREKEAAREKAREIEILQTEHLKQIRNFLADTTVAFERLKEQVLTNIALTRALATLQVHSQLLDKWRDELTALEDILALKRFQTGLHAFIEAKSAAGEITNNPFATVSKEIADLEQLLQEVHELYSQAVQFRLKMPPQDSPEQIHAAIRKASMYRQQLDNKLPSLRDRFGDAFWTPDHDLMPDLLIILHAIEPEPRLASMPRRHLCMFVNREGDYYEKVVERLNDALTYCRSLLVQYEKDQSAIEEDQAYLEKSDASHGERKIRHHTKTVADIDDKAVIKRHQKVKDDPVPERPFRAEHDAGHARHNKSSRTEKHEEQLLAIERISLLLETGDYVQASKELESLERLFGDIDYDGLHRRCEELRLARVHEIHEAALYEAMGSATRGDYRTARGLLDDLDEHFSDLDYDGVAQKCVEWEESLRSLQELSDRYRKAIEAQPHTSSLLLPASLDPKVRERRRMIQQCRTQMQPWVSYVPSNPGSEYAREIEPILKDIEQYLRKHEG